MTAVNYSPINKSTYFSSQILKYVSRIVQQMSFILYGNRYLGGHGFNIGPPLDEFTPNYNPFGNRTGYDACPPPTVSYGKDPGYSNPTEGANRGIPGTSHGSVISSVAPPGKEYAQSIVNYAKKFQGQQGTFSADDLSKLYGFTVTYKNLKNLDLNGDNSINLEEATAGLAFEDNTGAKADGKISSEDISAASSLFDLSVQGNEPEVAAKIKANQDTISQIDQAMNLKQYTG